jgi:hypothetical protein
MSDGNNPVINPKIDKVCARCGSSRISSDATAVWDVHNQCWEIASVHDHTYCPDCDEECDREDAPYTGNQPGWEQDEAN